MRKKESLSLNAQGTHRERIGNISEIYREYIGNIYIYIYIYIPGGIVNIYAPFLSQLTDCEQTCTHMFGSSAGPWPSGQ